MNRNERLVDRRIDAEHLVEPDQSQWSPRRRTVRHHGKPGSTAQLLMRRRQQRHACRCEETHITEIDDHSRRRLLEHQSNRLRQVGSRHQIQFTGYGQNHILITPFHNHIEVLGPEAADVVRSHTATLLRRNPPTRNTEVHQM